MNLGSLTKLAKKVIYIELIILSVLHGYTLHIKKEEIIFYTVGPNFMSFLYQNFRLCTTLPKGSVTVPQMYKEFVHGLLEHATYGGHIDNYLDLRVLPSCLKQFFNSVAINAFNQSNKKSVFPYSFSLPKSCLILDYCAVIETLPEDDKPSFFGLLTNIAHLSQHTISSQVVSQLRIMGRSLTVGCKFNREIWSNELSPVLNL